MALIGLGIVGLFVWAILSGLPNKTYRCQRCNFETNDETTAIGHEKREVHKCI
jgi:hypothetical protein